MPARWFICPDKEKIEISDCLNQGGCRMGSRCATRSYLQLVRKERPWTGRPSTTQLIQGTMCAFLKLTKDYAIYPDSRAFMIHGTKGHTNLEAAGDEYSLLEEAFTDDETEVTGIADVLEQENGHNILVDYKTSGSFKVAKALGIYIDEVPTGEIYKTGNRTGKPKTTKIIRQHDSMVDRWEWDLQLNKYRMEFERRGIPITEMRIQCVVRDGNTFVAKSRGITRNIYYFMIDRLPDDEVKAYFTTKKEALLTALEQGHCNSTCSAKENWNDLKCKSYCEVADYCVHGKRLKLEENDQTLLRG